MKSFLALLGISLLTAPGFSATSTTDGIWQQSPPPTLFGQSNAYDSARGRLIVFGGLGGIITRNDVWSLSLSGVPRWSRVMPSGDAPSPRYGATMTYDPIGDRALIFGGVGSDGLSMNDLWELSFVGRPRWTQLRPAGATPPPVAWHSAVYDPVHREVVMIGGESSFSRRSVTNETWVLSLTGAPSWRRLDPTGALPEPRAFHDAVFDPVHGGVVVLMGFGSGPVGPGDVWELMLGPRPEWRPLIPPVQPPYGGDSPAAVYDPVSKRVVIATNGGRSIWALSLEAPIEWSEIALAPGAGPMYADRSAIYDAANARMVVFGGRLSQAWALLLGPVATWSTIPSPANQPAARWDHAAVYDSRRHRAIEFGGIKDSFWYSPESLFDDIWTFPLAGAPAWTSLKPAGTPPLLFRHSATYDSVSDRMLVFGGIDSLGTYSNDLWGLTSGEHASWTRLGPSGAIPSAREGHSAVLDPVRRRIIVFGGDGPAEVDVWALELSGSMRWIRLHPSGTPPSPRYGHTAIYDPEHDRMIVYGGIELVHFRYVGDTWGLSLSEPMKWSELFPVGTTPPAREEQSAVYDPVRNRMVVFGGRAESAGAWPIISSMMGSNDTWALSLGAVPRWTKLDQAGIPPDPRLGAPALYDPLLDRMVILQGVRDGGDRGLETRYSDIWSLFFAPPTREVEVEIRPDRFRHRNDHGFHDLTQLAVLSRDDFQAAWIDPSSLTLGGSPLAPRGDDADRAKLMDVNGDGLIDLVIRVESDRLKPEAGSGVATLRGLTRDGNRIAGLVQIWKAREHDGGDDEEGHVSHSASLSSEVEVPAELGLRIRTPGSDGIALEISLPDDGPARLEAFDVLGRRLLSREVGGAGAGVHEIRLAGRHELSAGLYLLRLTQGRHSATAKAILLP